MCSIFAITVLLAPSVAVAKAACGYMGHASHFIYPSPTGENRFRINHWSFLNLAGLGVNNTNYLVSQAMSQWNNVGNSGYFRYVANTFVDDPEYCGSLGGDSLLIYHDPPPGTQLEDDRWAYFMSGNQLFGCTHEDQPWGYAVPGNLLNHGTCSGSQWVVVICHRPNYSFFGDPISSQFDFVTLLTHEFGHVLDYQHTLMPSVMNPWPPGGQLGARWSELFPHDVTCNSLRGYREVDIHVYEQTGTTFVPHTMGDATAIKATPMEGHWGTEPNARLWIGPLSTSDPNDQRMAIRARRGLISGGTSAWVLPTNDHHGILPSGAAWPDYSPQSHAVRGFVARDLYHDYSSWGDTFRVFQRIYNPEWMQVLGSSYLRRCLATGYPCTWNYVSTGHPVSFAWDDYSHSTVMAHVEQVRLIPDLQNFVRISVRAYDSNVLGFAAQPSGAPLRSSVGAAVACKYFQAFGGNDCLLAFVPMDDTTGRVHFRSFYFSASPPYTVYWNPTTQIFSPARTGSPIALWWHDGYFWMAIQQSATFNVRVYRSTDGSSWTVIQDLGYSITAPRVTETSQNRATAHLYLSQ